MKLLLNHSLANGYTNRLQIARGLTENWVKEYAFCPNFPSKLYKLENNSKAEDFYCKNCHEIRELKSKNPNFLFLTHECLHVKDFLAAPKHFLTPNLIEKRVWIVEILNLIEKFNKTFSLKDVYDFEKEANMKKYIAENIQIFQILLKQIQAIVVGKQSVKIR